ncbi:DNA helicase [Tanacetum coccineum]
MNSDIEDDIMDPVMQCTTLPSHSSFSQQKLVSFVMEIHTTSIDFLTPSTNDSVAASFQLKSDSLPHAHAQTTKTYYKHQDSRIKKAQPGFYPELMLKPRDGRGKGKKSRLDYIRKHQNDLRSDYLSGLYDVVSRGDREGINSGSKIMLPSTFTGGPRVFEQKVEDFVRFLNEVQTFGYVIAGPGRILAKVSRSIGEASTSTAVNNVQIDKIQDYVDGRFICPFEACWRIYNFPIHSREPAVQILNFHLENMQCLLGDDKEWDIALEESAGSGSSAEIRTLFAQILIYCDVANPGKLWTKHWQIIGDDISAKVSKATRIPNYHVNTAELQRYILYELEAILNRFGKSVIEFGLHAPPQHLLEHLKNKQLMKEKNYKRDSLMPHISFQDEAPMNDRRCFETLDRLLRDLMNAPEILFRGKTVVLGATLKTPTTGGLQEKAIVCPKNDTADAVNAKNLSSIEGHSKTYVSINEAIPIGRETSETEMLYPMEYLNTITFPGFPPHEL